MPKGESKKQVEQKVKKSADAKSVSSTPKEEAKRSSAGVKAGRQAESVKTGKKAVKTAAHPAKTGAKAGSKASQPAKEKMHSDEPRFGEFDAYLFGQATHHEIYQKMGAHPGRVDGVDGVWFTVWAPNAKGVGVIGEFNGWNDANDMMKKVASMGVYEKFVPGAKVGQLYKYKIYAASGDVLFKADPYAFWAEKRPGTASRIADISTFRWTDAAWMKKREKFVPKSSALSIYEVHPGSWMKHPYSPENPEGFYNYRLFAERLTEYVLDMGYTHVELMGIAEHPLDASWGYQVTGYYAPTSRYGKPEDFKYLVNYLHEHGIGVILDWVPAHFPKDEQGLANFDGQPVYEHEDPRLGEHPDWGTKIFNYGRPQVKNFLIGNALFWVEEYHVDGLRVDAVASMLYLDYGRKDGEWIPNKNGGNENLEAIEFFKHLNTLVTGKNKGVMMIAEESTAWPHVTGDVEKEDGLGFTLKWNMGWMHDFLDYMKLDPYFRKGAHNKMTFAMTYAFSENYILVLSHDEVVHLKCSMLEKMPGYEDDKFENLKAGYAFMFGHPGKKLLFMGQDFGQHREWSEERELDWFLLQDERNEHLQAFVRDLLSIYRKYPALYANDSGYEGFQWVNANDADRSIFSFIRWSPDQKNNLLFICNFTPMDRPDYCVGVPRTGSYELILDSREIKYGGSHKSEKKYRAWKGECDGQPYYISYELPPYGVAVFRFD
jgi:1,4-alpha-glucan branching enzyme